MTAAVDGTAAPRSNVGRVVLLALWIALTVAIVTAARTLPWRSAAAQARHVELEWVFAAMAGFVVPLLVWTQEWRLLTPGPARIGYGRMFEVVAVMAAVLNSVPFFAGEAAGVGMLIGRGGLSRGAALSVLATDQLLGGVVKIVILGAAALAIPLPTWLRAGILALVAGVAALTAIIVPLAHRWHRMHGWLLRTPTAVRILAARAVALGAHFDAVRETHRVWRVTILALGKKLVELASIVAIQLAFGLPPDLGAALLVLAALAIATMLPIAPANLGVYEAAVFGAYRYVGIPSDTALGLAVVQHVVFLLPTLATGYLTLTLRQLRARPGQS